MKEQDSILTLKEITKQRGQKVLYKDFSYSFLNEKVTTILAESGSGKTTLLDMIAELLQVDNGKIIFDNSDKKNNISYVFQEPRLLPWLTVFQNLNFVLEKSKENNTDKILYYLQKVGLEKKAESYPNQLSGGEKQRVSLARAFLFDSSVLLLDEAFQSQDIKLKLQLMQLFLDLQKEEKRTTIMVTHDIKEALCLSDIILLLKGTPLQIVKEFFINEIKNDSSIKDCYCSKNLELNRIEDELLANLLEN